MKLTDAFAKTIKFLGIKHVFGLQGGAVVHFFDSLEKLKVGVTYNHHEESAALAATASRWCSFKPSSKRETSISYYSSSILMSDTIANTVCKYTYVVFSYCCKFTEYYLALLNLI